MRELHRSSPLRSAGIVKGDVLIALDAVQLTGPQDLDLFLKEISPAGTFILTYSRAGQVNTVRVRAEAAPEIPPRRQTLISGRNPFSGAIMANLSPAVGTELELGALERGVVIIDPGARTANTNGFRKRDIVSEINERKTETVSDLVSALAAGNRKWRMRVKRSGRVIRLALVQTKSPTVRTERTALHARKSTTQGITSRSAVLKLQRDLSALGYDPGPKDGVLGNRVRSAISAFRRDRGIRQSGELSPWLLRKIHEAAKRKNEAANTSMVPPVEEEGPLKLEGLDELD
ncbi:MAG: hypothetical protein GY948_10635 [Alphaproteobacteria bacterium]|nr:hypothetical protein [Alphaproteobacteria bacterium]